MQVESLLEPPPMGRDILTFDSKEEKVLSWLVVLLLRVPLQ